MKIDFRDIDYDNIDTILTNPPFRLQEGKNAFFDILMFFAKTPVKRVIFLGSSCIYPKNSKIPIKEDYIMTGKLEKTNEAYEKGIFGAPTFVSNNKIFWGQDRIEFALKEASK